MIHSVVSWLCACSLCVSASLTFQICQDARHLRWFFALKSICSVIWHQHVQDSSSTKPLYPSVCQSHLTIQLKTPNQLLFVSHLTIQLKTPNQLLSVSHLTIQLKTPNQFLNQSFQTGHSVSHQIQFVNATVTLAHTQYQNIKFNKHYPSSCNAWKISLTQSPYKKRLPTTLQVFVIKKRKEGFMGGQSLSITSAHLASRMIQVSEEQEQQKQNDAGCPHTHTHKQAQYATMTTYAMVMQASRTTCDLRSLTPMTKLGSRTLSCWGKSSRSAAPFMIKARNSLNWNTKADRHHNSAVLAGTTEQEWPEPRGSRAGKYTQSHPWFSLLQSPVVWNICLSKTNSLLSPPFPCLFLFLFCCYFCCFYFISTFLPVCFAIVLKSHPQMKMEEEEEGKVNLQRRQNG